MTPDQIRALRRALGESTAQFATRFARSARTIEAWEQGRRRPDPLALRLLTALADQIPESAP